MNLPQAVEVLLPPMGNKREQVTRLCGEQKSTTDMRYIVFCIKMETMGVVEVVRMQLQNWEEMRNRMLAEREKNKTREQITGGEKGYVLK